MRHEEAFLENASRLFEAARNSAAAGSSNEFTILVAHDGAVRIVAGSDWPLETVGNHHGARMAFRVRHTEDRRVRLEGRSGSRSCLLEAAKPAGDAHLLLSSPPCYELSPGTRYGRRLDRSECGPLAIRATGPGLGIP